MVRLKGFIKEENAASVTITNLITDVTHFITPTAIAGHI